LPGGCLYSREVNAEFNWWLLIVGLVIGAGLVWLILADSSRREVDITTRERAGEARWIGTELRRVGRRISDEEVEDVLELHASYLGAPPPDDPLSDEAADEWTAPAAAARRLGPTTDQPSGASDQAATPARLSPPSADISRSR